LKIDLLDDKKSDEGDEGPKELFANKEKFISKVFGFDEGRDGKKN